jgi:ribosomal protein S18 acetylase RimI-like enzyme
VELRPVEFSEQYIPRVQRFECGSGQWAELAAEWIKQSPPFPGALLTIREHGNKVWLYYVDAVDEEYLVGFSSLGITRWKIPAPPDGEERDVGLIPMLAVALAFQGKPRGDDVKRYSRQILDHVIAQARERGYRELCLSVSATNLRAIKLYQRAGFKILGPKDGRNNYRMLKLLD